MNKDAIIKLVNEQLWTKGEADVPQFKAGDTITVSYKIVEGNKERVQSFRGVVIQIKGSGKTKMFTIPRFPTVWASSVSSPSIRPTSSTSRSTRWVSCVAHVSTTCAS